MVRKMMIKCGDAYKVLKKLAASTVQLTITSPPYFRHRDYGVNGQIGQERTLDEYLNRLQSVLGELRRVTTDTGSCFVVVGDTYRNGRLLLVPHRLALVASDLGWCVRNDIIFHKLDPAPESAKNRWRVGHEHILFLTKKASGYVFKDAAIRIPYSPVTLRRWGKGQKYGGEKSENRSNHNGPRLRHGRTFVLNPEGCVPTDVWSMPCGNSKTDHYAAFSPELVAKIVEVCSNPNDMVLDPFAGSGTVCATAMGLGRQFLGIELNPQYAAVANRMLRRRKRAL